MEYLTAEQASASLIAASEKYFNPKNGKGYFSQRFRDRILLDKLIKNKKAFTGAHKGDDLHVKLGDFSGVTMRSVKGAESMKTDAVGGLMEATFPIKKNYVGVHDTFDRLEENGIIIDDANYGRVNKGRVDAKVTNQLINLQLGNMDAMMDGFLDGALNIAWGDGTSDPGSPPGVLSFITEDPTTPVQVGGIDQSKVEWWRNRTAWNIDVSSVTNEPFTKRLEHEMRHLRRAAKGQAPNLVMLFSESALEALQAEIRANSSHSVTGLSGTQDPGMGDLKFKGVPIIWDPWLDENGRDKQFLILDLNAIHLQHKEGYWMQRWEPPRPYDKQILVWYMVVKWAFTCTRRRTSLIGSIQ